MQSSGVCFFPFGIPKLAFEFSVYHLLAILKQQLKLQIFTPMLNCSCGVNVDIDSTHRLLLCEAPQTVNLCFLVEYFKTDADFDRLRKWKLVSFFWDILLSMCYIL